MPVYKKISYIISTHNRSKSLVRCLASISKLSYPNWELIIVDNGSTDNTVTIVREFQSDSAISVKLVEEPTLGVSYGRNAGIQASEGEIIAFSDDDCYPASDYLENIFSVFDKEDDVGYVSGRIELYDPDDAPVSINTDKNVRYFAPYRYIRGGLVWGANMAFRRSVLDKIGLFDMRFGPGTNLPAAEDRDLAMRASLAGFKGKYCPEIVVYHHHGRKSGDMRELSRGYNIGRGGFNAKLLLSKKTFLHGLLGWGILSKRIIFGQTYVVDEVIGGFRYLKSVIGDR
jgi:GT2 family glycosyltransferase